MAIISRLNNLVELAKEKSSERRRTLLREVTDLFFEETPETDTTVSHKFDALLSTLAEQAAQDTREELAERFADTPYAPRGLILQLAQDAIEVAAPILSRSNGLTDADLIDIAQTAEQTHLKAISQREIVPEQVSEAIVRRGDDETVAKLVGNDGAKLSRDAFEAVSQRAETAECIQGPLVERGDTPNDLLADLMLAVNTHLRETIQDRFDTLDPDVLEQAMAASRARLATRLTEDREIEDARKYVKSMAVRKQLNGTLLARLLRERALIRFNVAFAELTGVDYMTAKRAIDQDCIDPLALICKAAGFDKGLFVTLAVLRGSASEEAFRDAPALGALYDAVSNDDAARAMRFWRMRRDMAA